MTPSAEERAVMSDEALFFGFATADLIQAAGLFRPIHDATDGVDGRVSLEVSPLLADDTAGWGSPGNRDPTAPDGLYIEALAAPDTINTMPQQTLLTFAAHGEVKGTMPPDGGDAEAVLADFAAAGVNDDTLATYLQREGTAAFAKSLNGPMHRILMAYAMALLLSLRLILAIACSGHL